MLDCSFYNFSIICILKEARHAPRSVCAQKNCFWWWADHRTKSRAIRNPREEHEIVSNFIGISCKTFFNEIVQGVNWQRRWNLITSWDCWRWLATEAKIVNCNLSNHVSKDRFESCPNGDSFCVFFVFA